MYKYILLFFSFYIIIFQPLLNAEIAAREENFREEWEMAKGGAMRARLNKDGLLQKGTPHETPISVKIQGLFYHIMRRFMFTEKMASFLTAYSKYAMYVLVGILLLMSFLFLALIFRKKRVLKKEPGIVTISQIEEEKRDIAGLRRLLENAEKALIEKDYRSAIHLFFCYLVMVISIKLPVDAKTPREIGNILPRFESFSRIISLYERVWFGKDIATENDTTTFKNEILKAADIYR